VEVHRGGAYFEAEKNSTYWRAKGNGNAGSSGSGQNLTLSSLKKDHQLRVQSSVETCDFTFISVQSIREFEK